ncbi:MAG: hypothetical protein ACTSU5_21805 [Promethearchaeota archaeon]
MAKKKLSKRQIREEGEWAEQRLAKSLKKLSGGSYSRSDRIESADYIGEVLSSHGSLVDKKVAGRTIAELVELLRGESDENLRLHIARALKDAGELAFKVAPRTMSGLREDTTLWKLYETAAEVLDAVQEFEDEWS